MAVEHRRAREVAALVAASLALTGCGPDETPTREPTDLAGPDRPVTVARTPLWEVGGVDAPEWAAFGEVSDLDFDDEGNLHVLDGVAGRVTVVGPSGELDRTYGTPGQGPGEVSAPGPLVVHGDGSAALYDYGHGAWLRYDADGSFRDAVRVPGDGSAAPGAAAFRGADGSIVAAGTGPVEAADRWVTPVRRYPVAMGDAEGTAPTTLFEARALPPPPPPVIDQVSLGGRSITVRIPRERGFEPGLHLAVFRDGGIAVADSSAWRIEIREADGALVRVLARPIEPRPVTEALEEAERARRLARVADGELPGFMISTRAGDMSPADRGSVRQFMEARLENMVFTERVPVITGLSVDSRGTLWVARSSEEPGAPGPIDLVTREGVYLGTLEAGTVPEPRAFGPDGLAAWVSTDDLGVLRVRVERVSAPSSRE